MVLDLCQKGFNYAQDGPGNRLVYHVQGCNLHCPWCSNPESIARHGTIMMTGQDLPTTICPWGSIRANRIDYAQCCACVGRECLTHPQRIGLKLSCQRYAVADLIAEAWDSRPLFFDGGGVTVSGGEPTLQFAGLQALLTGLKDRGIHTAIETNGTHPQLADLFPWIDLLIIDLKHPDPVRHQQLTGTDNSPIELNLQQAFQRHPQVLVRTPLINAVNTSPTDLQAFLAFYTQFDTSHAVFEFLPYHAYGKVKWAQCGLDYSVQNGEISDDVRQMFEQAYRGQQLHVTRT